MEYHFERVRFIDDEAKAKCLVYALLESGAPDARTYLAKWWEKYENNPKFEFDREVILNQLRTCTLKGLRLRNFRKEKDCFAIPFIKEEYRAGTNNVFRLYCLPVFGKIGFGNNNQDILFLFEIGIKTSRKAQDCPNVGPLFHRGNAIAKVIESIKDAIEPPYQERIIIPTQYD